MTRISRREALRIASLAVGTVLLPIGFQYRGYTQVVNGRVPFTLPFRTPPVLNPVRSDATTDYYQITMRTAPVQILPGPTTEIWGYNGQFPGPTIKQQQNRISVVRFINNLDVNTSVHLHGMQSSPQHDGYATDPIPPRHYKDYIYANPSAAVLWYHDHTLAQTTRNVYMGLAGMYIVENDDERALSLPNGDYDVPLIIQDRQLAPDGSLILDDQNRTHVMGDLILVNGVPWPRMEVANRKYRFRVLNASVSRSYRLALSTGDNLIVIGTDGGLISAPVNTLDLRLAAGERYDFIIDFSRYPIGTQVELQNLPLPDNDYFPNIERIMRFDVVRSEVDNSVVPSTLRTIELLPESAAVRTRDFLLDQINGMWVINGNGWDSNRIDANPQLEEIEIWRFLHPVGAGVHPMHLHAVKAQILDRNGQPPLPYERGWKDVFYVGENETVRVIGRFRADAGKYMYHCHNMVHEDFDMMGQFEVGLGGIDPVSAPARPLPAPPL
ncbi:bilirubin oxidase [Scytonema hofmannii PCC 7110]|uniref:Bilirubin oxidase n=1 Tax=Scytonema hofmannii PCC 7110 TaxID=128403 RepID=A0A139WRE6_9CYAN|nr:multicopper oxidase family protein [Scytonema hofmannii]KYC35003.1 bilirubin oxidase [Scytonema hofmannii PCC 7110]